MRSLLRLIWSKTFYRPISEMDVERNISGFADPPGAVRCAINYYRAAARYGIGPQLPLINLVSKYAVFF